MWAMARWENKMIWMSLEENIKTIFSALKESDITDKLNKLDSSSSERYGQLWRTLGYMTTYNL